ncbi:MAG TPA: UDP-2,3-diacylglucosamine diphosphatase [Bacteroidetes bacterium]|nr:UDP-2,3-diacylglucosamine hydrolase [bacterium BMS3Bbin04]HDO65803.1 UDP-2,3-diacylglucosamine diphosphatase [Bacteroidota bacterium]HEX04928.1 UDP-2,3-diacylglucosamine diphosphatase [Bacteroidota bacterium]
MQTSKQNRVLIIADAHLPLDGKHGADAELARVTKLVEEHRSNLSMLILLGDTFDFWFEWSHVIPKAAFTFLTLLRDLTHSGIPVHIFAGNHDFMLGSFLNKQVGAHLHMDEWTITIDDQRYYFHHGDGFAASDKNYRRMKAVFRTRIMQGLFGRLVHPDLAMKIASWVSSWGSNKVTTSDGELPIYKEYCETAQSILRKGHDIVVIGHMHQAFLTKLDGGHFFNPGPYLGEHRYGVIEGGLPRSEVDE